MFLASFDPQRVRRLILVAPANPWAPRGRWLAPLLSSKPIRWAVPTMCRTPAFQEWQLRRMYGDPGRIAVETLPGYLAPFTQPGSIEHILRILTSWRKDLRELQRLLPSIAEIPTLFLWGDRDRVVIPQSARPLKAHFRRAELVTLNGIGHLPYEEAPEAFNRAVLDFLAR